MADESLLFLRVANRSQLAYAAGGLTADGNIRSWDAVDGLYQAVARCSGASQSCRDVLSGLGVPIEISECRIIEQGTPVESNPDHSRSYVMLDADRDCVNSLRDLLSSMDTVIFWAVTEGPFNLVAIIEGESFGAIDRVIEDQIAPAEGLLRYRQTRVLESHPIQE